MDIEEFIKIEEPCFSYHHENFQNFNYDVYGELYNQDSQMQQDVHALSIDQVLEILQEREDFIDRPLDELVSQSMIQFQLDAVQIQYFRRRIKKQKNIMKRNRAKIRKYSCYQHEQIVRIPIKEEEENSRESTEHDKQIKKQRNRISAQISRDRKKNYVSSLQRQNQELSKEAETLKKENEILKKQIQLRQTKNTKSSTQQNKFVKLLIMLGLLFFLYIMGDAFKSANNQEVELKRQETVANQKFGSIKFFTVQEEKQCFQVLDEPDYGGPSVKNKVMSAISDLKKKTSQIFMPFGLDQKLREITKKYVS